MVRRLLISLATISLLALALAPGATAGHRSHASINAEIDAYVLAHPMDFIGIDELAFRYTSQHIVVGVSGASAQMTADEASTALEAYRAAEAQSGDVSILSGIPDFVVVITSVPISGGGRTTWGTWDFPDTWAGQGAPVDIAGQTFGMSTCVQMSNLSIWTYKVNGGSTNLGALRQVYPALAAIWNVSDYTSGFASMVDRGTTKVELRRGSGCPATVQIGAAFDYEANQQCGIANVSVGIFFFSVSYTCTGLTRHKGTAPIYFNI